MAHAAAALPLLLVIPILPLVAPVLLVVFHCNMDVRHSTRVVVRVRPVVASTGTAASVVRCVRINDTDNSITLSAPAGSTLSATSTTTTPVTRTPIRSIAIDRNRLARSAPTTPNHHINNPLRIANLAIARTPLRTPRTQPKKLQQPMSSSAAAAAIRLRTSDNVIVGNNNSNNNNNNNNTASIVQSLSRESDQLAAQVDAAAATSPSTRSNSNTLVDEASLLRTPQTPRLAPIGIDELLGDMTPFRHEQSKPSPTASSARQVFTFDRIFREESTQAEVAQEILPYVEAAVDGFNCAVFTTGYASIQLLSATTPPNTKHSSSSV
jgi:hypothetical protein